MMGAVKNAPSYNPDLNEFMYFHKAPIIRHLCDTVLNRLDGYDESKTVVMDFNDNPKTTHAEVLQVLDWAIETATE